VNIYQSFFSKPFLEPFENSFEVRKQGGYPLIRYFLYTMALSACRLKDIYGNVTLVTDKKGKEILIDYCNIPFTSSILLFDDIYDLPSYLWAGGKIYFYTKIKKPFLHFDGDFILGSNFNKRKIVLNMEKGINVEFFYCDAQAKIYSNLLNKIYNSTEIKLKKDLKEFIKEENFIMSYFNLGVIGSNNSQIINEIGQYSYDFMRENEHLNVSNIVSLDFYNFFAEQYLFYFNTKKANLKPITYYHSLINDLSIDNFNQITPLMNVTEDFECIHLANQLKLNYYKSTEKWLKHFYPKTFDHINNALGL